MALKLVRLIEKHSEELVQGLAEQIRASERTCDFRRIPPAELELAAAEVYRNLGEWLLQKTEDDIQSRFGAITEADLLQDRDEFIFLVGDPCCDFCEPLRVRCSPEASQVVWCYRVRRGRDSRSQMPTSR